jgi:hypothetical protein
MAAGLGTRYGGAKQVDGVGPAGETLLEFGMFDARRAGFGQAVFVIRREMAGAFDEFVGRLSTHFPSSYVIQDSGDIPSWAPPRIGTKPWGTVHALLAARHAVTTPFAAINADDFYGAAAYRLGRTAADDAAATGMCTIVGFPLEGTLSPHGPVSRGICECEGDVLTRVEEAHQVQRTADGVTATFPSGVRRLSGREIASMNFWVFAPSIFDLLQSRFDAFLRASGSDPKSEAALPNAIGDLVTRGDLRVRVVEASGPWFGLTHHADREAVQAALRDLTARGIYPSPLWDADRPSS